MGHATSPLRKPSMCDSAGSETEATLESHKLFGVDLCFDLHCVLRKCSNTYFSIILIFVKVNIIVH